MMTDVTILERFARTGPLGVRFWDAVERAFVADELVVRLRPKTASAPRVVATANTAAIFAPIDLPGLREAEHAAGDDAFWAAVVKRHYVVEVEDPRGRFLPFAFDADLPNRGLFVWSCTGAPAGGPSDGVPLFSSPSRPLAPMRAVLRADLRDATSARPAAGAVLTATIDGTLTVTGIADGQGRVAIQFPYPEPRDFPAIGDGSSPTAPFGTPLAAYAWPVTLTARYAPSATAYPAYPDLCTTLHQPAAQLWGDTTGAALPALLLHMGAELVVRTIDAVSSRPLSELLVRAP